MHKRKEEAEVALHILRGTTANVNIEMQEIEQGFSTNTEVTPWSEYIKRPLIKHVLIIVALFVVQMWCGATVIRSYTVTIFQSTHSNINPYYQTIISGVLLTIGACICSIIVDRVERRILLMFSGFTMTLANILFGLFYKLQEIYPTMASQYLQWMPLTAVSIHILGYSVGFSVIPYVIVGELFSTTARGRANSIGLIVQSLCGFLANKFFIDLKEVVQNYGVYWIYGGFCAMGVVLCWLFIPNTRGKSLEKIQRAPSNQPGSKTTRL